MIKLQINQSDIDKLNTEINMKVQAIGELTKDKMLQEVVIDDGMSNFRANYVYEAVRFGGVESAEKPRKIYQAP